MTQELIDSWPSVWPLTDSYFPSDLRLILESLIHDAATLVGDGLHKPKTSIKIGAAGWALECSRTLVCCRGKAQTSGQLHEVNSYQSELQGFHTGLLAALALCLFSNVASGATRIGCDKKGVDLSASAAPTTPLCHKHVDLTRAIHCVVNVLPIKVAFFHIKGHQDDCVGISSLGQPSQLNVVMDATAKALVDHLAWQSAPPAPADI